MRLSLAKYERAHDFCPDTGKIAYASKVDAQAIMNNMKRKKHRIRSTDRLNVFRCDLCGHWHVGNKSK